MGRLYKTLNTLLEFRDKIDADVLQIRRKWNWEWIV